MASVVDRLQAAKYTVTGNDVSKIVAKATTHEMGSPKRKHLDFLIQCTHSPNVSLPECADMLLARIQDPSWVVSVKAMISLHHLMNDGSEKFMRYMASKGNNFEFINEKTGPMAFEMYSFIKKYGHYLSEKCTAYLQATVDFNRISNSNFLRKAPTEKLLTYLPILQRQVDGLISLDLNSGDVCTDINRAAFILLYRDLIGLFKIYNEGMISLLEIFFEMEKKHAREAFDLYCKFVNRMEKVERFFKVAEDAGIDEGDVPDLSKAPSSLRLALENHLKSLENKGTPISSPTEMTQSPPAPPKSTLIKSSSDPFTSSSKDPFGDSFAPQQDLLSDPMLVNTTQTKPKSDIDELNDLWNISAAPNQAPANSAPPLIHNNESVLVESSFNPFTSSFEGQELFPNRNTGTVSAAQNSNVIDLLSDPIPEQSGSSFAQFQSTETEPSFLIPDRPNEPPQPAPVNPTQKVSSLMQDLDIGLKNAAANFSLSSPNKTMPAQGPVRPISSGTTYNPFIRPGYSGMMNTMQPMYGMQTMQPGMQAMQPGMQTMQPGMQTMQPGMQSNMGVPNAMTMPGMRPMNMMGGMPQRPIMQNFTMQNNVQSTQNSFDPFS